MTHLSFLSLRPRLALLLGASALLVACGSSGNNGAPGDGGSSGVDGSLGDAALGDGGVPSGDASHVEAGEAGPRCSAPGATQDTCRTCCETNFNAGYKIFANETVACACGASLCGPLDGGSADGAAGDGGDAGATDAAAGDSGAVDDGGLYGRGVCAATCNQVAAPDPTCNTCIYSTLGSVNALGPCGSVVLGQCLGDPSCNAYFGCVQLCP